MNNLTQGIENQVFFHLYLFFLNVLRRIVSGNFGIIQGKFDQPLKKLVLQKTRHLASIKIFVFAFLKKQEGPLEKAKLHIMLVKKLLFIILIVLNA